MEVSKPFDVLALGRRIVEESGLADSNDTLGRWIAHRIAELMQTAEHGRTAAAREAAKRDVDYLILRLWRQRSSWPNGWPPKASAAVLQELEPARFRAHEDREPSGSDWLDTLHELDALHRAERDAWVNFALLDFDFEQEQGLLSTESSEVSNRERETFRSLLYRRQHAEREIATLLEGQPRPTSRAARLRAATARLDELATERSQLVARALKGSRRRASASRPADSQSPPHPKEKRRRRVREG